MTRYPSIHSLDKPCPTCGVAVGVKCVTKAGRTTDSHHSRMFGVQYSPQSLQRKPRKL